MIINVPPRVMALAKCRAPPGNRAAFWLFVTDDGRMATAWAASLDDAARVGAELFPAIALTAYKIRCELGAPC